MVVNTVQTHPVWSVALFKNSHVVDTVSICTTERSLLMTGSQYIANAWLCMSCRVVSNRTEF